MPRSKRAVGRRTRIKKLFDSVKGYNGSRRRLIKTAKQASLKAATYQYRDRKVRKRDFRGLWIQRISAAARANGISYSQLMGGLSKAGVELNRKMLSELAIHDPAAFTAVVDIARAA